ncbi:MAG: bifunctional UDP-N-acetylglucosamine diphosphorylase/glucosamine-1-phosphate N-acetyltransferase GlmU [Acidobacteria bacterium]|nr:bifunctional UDP-N-acetylglucosamine diphosphorylase/glucosamine-1-phosphate N-acetyltransferase GlmU [Acidobacteriota bacterium]
MSDLHVVVLGAGKGTRMKSDRPKVLHRVGGIPMIEHVLRTIQPLNPVSATVVVGHMANMLRAALAGWPGLQFALQEPQAGTAHALLQTKRLLEGKAGCVVLLSGDVPLLRTTTIEKLVKVHRQTGAAATILTAIVEQPYGYGRIVKRHGEILRIVEEKDAAPAERRIREVNSGIYAFDLAPLFQGLKQVGTANAQGEYYLTDLVAVYRRERRRIATLPCDDASEIRGINSRAELAEVSRIVNQQRNEALMASGVTLEDPATIYVGPDVAVGPDTVIHPGVHLEGKTTIGSACEIHAGVRIVDSHLADGVTIRNFCVITNARIEGGARVGPFAHIRPESGVGPGAHIGNFVELKKAIIGAGAKANHLTYLGDVTVGAKANVGAGTITCNYDGERKHQTVIEAGAFIGSGTELVAPVRVGRDAYVAAGSTITEDVPPGSLAIARGRQVNKAGWADKRKGS